MMLTLLSIATAVLSVANYYLNISSALGQSVKAASLAGQAGLVLISIIAMFLYRGRHISIAQYAMRKKFIFTLRFGLIVLSVLINLAVLAWFILPQFH